MNMLLLSVLLACQGLAGGQPLVGAHRGLGSGHPENTLSAFQASLDAGVDIVELDLRTTRDGVIVVMHDPSVDRTTDGTGRVASLSYAEVSRLRVDGEAREGSAREHVPRLDEVLRLVRGREVRLLLDVKDGARVNLAEVIRQAQEHEVLDRIVLGVRRLADLAAARALGPDLTILAFVPALSQIDAFVAGGADIVRLWTDWIAADAAATGAIRRNGSQVWAMIGPTVPRDSVRLRALHERAACAPVEAVVTDTPQLLPPRRR